MAGEWNSYLVAINILLVVTALIVTRLSPWVVFSASIVVLFLLDILSLQQITTGFTSPSLLVLVLLFLVSIPLERTQLMRRLTDNITSGTLPFMVAKLSLFSGLFSAVVNNTAVVAAMLGPLKNQRIVSPSKLLLPLSYASILGGTLTLIGTSTNLIVNGFVVQAGLPELGFFDFTPVGVPVFIVCTLVMLVLSSRVLPDRNGTKAAVSQDYFLERRVTATSPLVGKTVLENGLRRLETVFLIEVIRAHQAIAPVTPHEVIQADDILVFTGDLAGVGVIDSFEGLELVDDTNELVRDNLIEVIISPTSNLVGRTIKEVDFRARFDAAVVAVRRGDQRLKGGLGNLRLKAGDSLVLAVGDDFGRRGSYQADFIVVGGITTQRQLGKVHGVGVIFGFALVIGLAALGMFSLLKGLVVLIVALLVSRVLTIEELKNRFPYELLVVIGSALGLSQAMFSTGLASSIGDFAGFYLSGMGPLGGLIGVFLMTWIMTELMTNNAAAAIMFPLALAISSFWPETHMAFVMAVAFGASASFISPYGYQTNLMVYTAGNYRLADYIKFGVPVSLAYSITAVSMINWLFL